MALKDVLQVAVVDDTAVSRGLLVNTLEEIGLRDIEVHKNGEEALVALLKRPRHLVLSDMHMPKLDGLGLLEKLRANEATARIGFILVSGKGDDATIARGKSLKMNNYLEKPFDDAKLRRTIEAVVGSLG